MEKIEISECIAEADKKELYEIFHDIVEEGFSYPQELPYSYEDFLGYFFSLGSKVIICRNGNEITGGFYLKPNNVGRAKHIANAGYVVKKNFRGKKIGIQLGRYSIDLAKELGYLAMQFNLVFSQNIPSIKLWEKLGFRIVGTVPNAAKMDDGSFQDAYIMHLNLDASS